MEDTELYGGLSRATLDEYAQEAKERWGNTKAYQQSQERMKGYGKQEYAALAAEQEEATRALAATMDKGPESPEAQEQIDQAFKFINERFYDCSLDMFLGLAEMTVQDQRYADYYEKVATGLAAFRLEAARHYCASHA